MARREPQAELARIGRLPVQTRRRMTVLTVWCESGRCSIARVMRLTSGHLLEHRRGTLLGSDDAGPFRVGGHAEWLEEIPDDELELHFSYSCDCDTTERHWKIGYPDVMRALADGRSNLGVAARRSAK